MARTLVGWQDAHFLLDTITNRPRVDAAIDVQVLATGEPVTDLEEPTGYTGQAFPTGQARSDGAGFYGFTVPPGTGVVRVRAAAYTVGDTTKVAGPWVTPVGQIVVGSGVDQALTDRPTHAEVSATYVRVAGTSAPTTVKASGDGRAGVWEWIHNDSAGYLWHLLAGTSFASPAALLALGMDNGNGTGLLVANKAGGTGIIIDQRATVVAADAYGIKATQRSPGSPLVRLEMQANDAAPLMQLLAFGAPGVDQQLLYVGDPAGEAGRIYAADGRIRWQRRIEVLDKDAGTPSWIDLTDNNGVPANTRTHTLLRKSGPEFYGYSGSAGQWWPFAVSVGGSRLQIKSGALTGTVGTPGALTNLLEFQNGKMGFFNAPPAAKPTGVAVTPEAIHAALVTLGLIAA